MKTFWTLMSHSFESSKELMLSIWIIFHHFQFWKQFILDMTLYRIKINFFALVIFSHTFSLKLLILLRKWVWNIENLSYHLRKTCVLLRSFLLWTKDELYCLKIFMTAALMFLLIVVQTEYEWNGIALVTKQKLLR